MAFRIACFALYLHCMCRAEQWVGVLRHFTSTSSWWHSLGSTSQILNWISFSLQISDIACLATTMKSIMSASALLPPPSLPAHHLALVWHYDCHILYLLILCSQHSTLSYQLRNSCWLYKIRTNWNQYKCLWRKLFIIYYEWSEKKRRKVQKITRNLLPEFRM